MFPCQLCFELRGPPARVGHRGLYSEFHYVFIRMYIREKCMRMGIGSYRVSPLIRTGCAAQVPPKRIKLTNSTVDCDIALLGEKEDKAGRSGRVQKRNIEKAKRNNQAQIIQTENIVGSDTVRHPRNKGN